LSGAYQRRFRLPRKAISISLFAAGTFESAAAIQLASWVLSAIRICGAGSGIAAICLRAIGSAAWRFAQPMPSFATSRPRVGNSGAVTLPHNCMSNNRSQNPIRQITPTPAAPASAARSGRTTRSPTANAEDSTSTLTREVRMIRLLVLLVRLKVTRWRLERRKARR